MTKPVKQEYLIGGALALFSLAVYAYTANPSIDVIDAGELTTVACTLGIAHPTGYPLFSMIGWIFTHLPIPLRMVYKANLMASFFCAAGIFFFFRFLVFFLGGFSLRRADAKPAAPSRKNETDNRRAVIIPAICGTLILAFSKTYWAQATSVEVYSLHMAFVMMLLFIFTKAISSGAGERPQGRFWYFFGYVLGLAFCNHMTTIMLAPAFLWAYFYTHRFGWNSWKKLFTLAPFFIFALTAYLFLPIRASEHPVMNWGDPSTFERFILHVRAQQYHFLMFASTKTTIIQVQRFFESLPANFLYFPLIFALLGIWKLWKSNKAVLLFQALAFFGCLGYAVNYNIYDIDSYFLIAYIAVGIWATAGIAFLLSYLRWRTYVVGTICVLVCLLPLVFNYQYENENDFYLVEQYVDDLFSSVEPGGIVFTTQFDYFESGTNYIQRVENKRKDIIVLGQKLLDFPWYYSQLAERYPWLVERSKPEIDAYVTERKKYDEDVPYDPVDMQFRYVIVIRSLILKNFETHPIYVTPELDEKYFTGFRPIPNGLTFRLYRDSLRHPINSSIYHYTIPMKRDNSTDNILAMYSRMDVVTAAYKKALGERDSAFILIDRALARTPDLQDAIMLKNILQNQ